MNERDGKPWSASDFADLPKNRPEVRPTASRSRETGSRPGADKRRSTGRHGEETAAAYLESRGYRMLHRNWRCRSGELDIVARLGGMIVIVEVRTRTNGGRFGTAAESVDYRKQRQVRMTAEVYLQTNRLLGEPVRFDVIAIVVDRVSGDVAEIKHIEGAF